MTAGITPIRTSVNANVASRAQSAMSAAAMSPRPPARAAPPIRATTGFVDSQIAASTSPSRPTGTRPVSSAAAVSVRSAPDEKTWPVWVNTITRTASSRSASSSAASSCSIKATERALRFGGLSSVSVATPRRTS
jgi:hypothetical protein